MATDIAFAVGILTLLGSRVPVGVKIFLLALAIVDDLGAVLVIAVFYTADISWLALGAGGVIMAVLVGMNVMNVRHPLPYGVLGILLWLAFLKSRMLLPKEKVETGEQSAEEMAQRLAFRLARLEAMRNAMAHLMTRKRLGRDVFGRGSPEGVKTVRDTEWTAQIYDLLKAYADQRRRTVKVTHVVKARKVWSIKEARNRLEKLVGESTGHWVQLDLFLHQYLPQGEETKTVIASSFGATLEMAREGVVELQQESPFAPLYVRKREDGATWQRIG